MHESPPGVPPATPTAAPTPTTNGGPASPERRPAIRKPQPELLPSNDLDPPADERLAEMARRVAELEQMVEMQRRIADLEREVAAGRPSAAAIVAEPAASAEPPLAGEPPVAIRAAAAPLRDTTGRPDPGPRPQIAARPDPAGGPSPGPRPEVPPRPAVAAARPNPALGERPSPGPRPTPGPRPVVAARPAAAAGSAARPIPRRSGPVYRGLPRPVRVLLWAVLAIAVGLVVGLTGPVALRQIGVVAAVQPGLLAWYSVRATGVIAYLALAGSVVYGLMLTTKLLDVFAHRPVSIALHKDLSIVGVILSAVHGALLLADQSFHFTPLAIIVPFTSPYAPIAVGIGQLAFYGMAVVTASFYVRRQMGQRAWRLLHYVTFAAFAGGSAHGIASGTDTATSWGFWLYLVPTVAVVFLFAYRLTMGLGRTIDRAVRRPAATPVPGRPALAALPGRPNLTALPGRSIEADEEPAAVAVGGSRPARPAPRRAADLIFD